jgi:aromatic-L-amino-acid decarboxylase
VHFALVTFRHTAGDAATDAIADASNATGSLYVTPSVLDGRRVIRVSVGQTHTTAQDVDRLWDVVRSAAA